MWRAEALAQDGVPVSKLEKFMSFESGGVREGYSTAIMVQAVM